MPDLIWLWQDEEKKRNHRLIRTTPLMQRLEISKGTGHTAGKERICGLPIHVILTHAGMVRPTQSPHPIPGATHPHSPGWPTSPDPSTWVTCPQSQGDLTSPDPAPGVTRPLGQDTMALQGAPPMWKQAGSLGPPGMGKSVRWVSFPHTCPRGVLLFSLWFCVILTVFTAFILELNTRPWCWHVQSFLVSLTCWENIQESRAESRGAALDSAE